ncbi:MAG: hypothetical protein PHQ28_00840 [Mycobacterium sp.]|nr:hypothetical protein [Mycobacterium sp.]
MMIPGDAHTAVGSWRITARRGFFDEAGDAYAFCVDEQTGRREVLQAVEFEAGWRITHLDEVELPPAVKAAALSRLAEVVGEPVVALPITPHGVASSGTCDPSAHERRAAG